MAKGGLIEDIERSTEFLSQVNNVTIANDEMALLTYLGGEGEKG
jgi:hypothetical protein